MRRIYKAPCGDLLIEAEDGMICRCSWTLDFHDEGHRVPEEERDMSKDDAALLTETFSQLDEYFKDERRVFDLPLRFCGTPFREKVWKALVEIQYGRVMTYSEVADKIGCRGSQRAVAQACSANRIAILVPCHRVVSSDGSLGGYTVTETAKCRGKQPEGLAIKRFLLSHEIFHALMPDN